MSEPLTNGHDKGEEIILLPDAVDVAEGSAVLQGQINVIQTAVARHAERHTIELLAKDAVRRLADAYRENNFQKQAEIVRELLRLELYLQKRGLV